MWNAITYAALSLVIGLSWAWYALVAGAVIISPKDLLAHPFIAILPISIGILGIAYVKNHLSRTDKNILVILGFLEVIGWVYGATLMPEQYPHDDWSDEYWKYSLLIVFLLFNVFTPVLFAAKYVIKVSYAYLRK